jgi:hypothetical protein
MSTITRRLDALEEKVAPTRRLVVLFAEPGDDAASAWARKYPGEDAPADADFMLVEFAGVDPIEDRPR